MEKIFNIIEYARKEAKAEVMPGTGVLEKRYNFDINLVIHPRKTASIVLTANGKPIKTLYELHLCSLNSNEAKGFWYRYNIAKMRDNLSGHRVKRTTTVKNENDNKYFYSELREKIRGRKAIFLLQEASKKFRKKGLSKQI